MEQKPSSVWEIIVPCVAFVVILGFLLVILGYRSPRPASPTTPAALVPTVQPPTPASLLTAEALAASPIPAANATPSPIPVIPEIAPDFTLEQAGGGTLTLSELLTQQPVVLVFLHQCG